MKPHTSKSDAPVSETSHLLPTYARAKLQFERGEGSWLITKTGERYLDFAAGVAVNSLGHAHPKLVAALQAQSEKLWHISNLYEIPEGEALAAKLCALTFAETMFFTNSGAEALECAIKMARKFHASNGQPERFHIITFEGAFHGRTLATIAATGNAKYLEGFGPKMEGFQQLPFGDFDALNAALDADTEETIGAILVEPVQGEGGLRELPNESLRMLREICDAHGLLLIFDEVQCGAGRTGKMFAHQWSGITPDIMAIAKGIGGGFPLGACLATKHAAKGMTAGTHGSTYGGNPLGMAVGNAVVDVISDPAFLQHVQDMSLLFKQRLAELKDRFPRIIADVRGKGLMLGLKVNVPNGEFVSEARAQKLLTVPAGDNVVRLLPPLNVTAEQISEAFQKLEAVCLEVMPPIPAKTTSISAKTA